MGLAYERTGSGPPLVLLHGLGHRRQAWYPVMDLLTPEREVILVDLPGHGESPPLQLRGRTAAEAMADDTLRLLTDLGLERPHIAGNSLGGLLALVAGARDGAATVTALSPAGFWAHRWQFGYARAVFGIMQFAARSLGPATPAVARSAAGRAVLLAAIVSRPTRMSPEQTAADARAFAAASDAIRTVLAAPVSFTEAVPAQVPVTIAWGSRDRLLPRGQALAAKALLPQARFVRLAGCGHVPMTDDPRLVARVLLDGSNGAS